MSQYAVQQQLPYIAQDDAADEVRHEEHRAEQLRATHYLREHVCDEERRDIDKYGGDDGEGHGEQQRVQEIGILHRSGVILQTHELGIGDRREFSEAEVDTHHQRHHETECEGEACRKYEQGPPAPDGPTGHRNHDRDSSLTVGELVFTGPVVGEYLGDVVPVAVALSVIELGGAEVLLPLVGDGGDADHIGLPRLLVFAIGVHQRVVDLILFLVEARERGDQSHVLGNRLKRGIGGDQPVQELLGGLLVLFGDLGVHTPVVADHLIQSLLFLAFDANVDRERSQVIIGYGLALDLVVDPHAILEEHRLTGGEFSDGIIHGLAGQGAGLDRRVLDIQVEDVLHLLDVGALDTRRDLGHIDTVIDIFVIQRHAGKVEVVAEGRAGVESSRAERPLDPEVALVGLDLVGDDFQRLEPVDVFDGFHCGPAGIEILLEQGLVVDDAIAFSRIGNGDRLAIVVGQRTIPIILIKLPVDIAAGEILGILHEAAHEARTIGLEHRGSGFLGEFRTQRRVVIRTAGLDLDRNACLLFEGLAKA